MAMFRLIHINDGAGLRCKPGTSCGFVRGHGPGLDDQRRCPCADSAAPRIAQVFAERAARLQIPWVFTRNLHAAVIVPQWPSVGEC